jgi:hypothetical protein
MVAYCLSYRARIEGRTLLAVDGQLETCSARTFALPLEAAIRDGHALVRRPGFRVRRARAVLRTVDVNRGASAQL